MENTVGLQKIVSGGQTGVDRGALDAAIAMGLPHGGWCPKRRQAEDGPIADCYQLRELDSSDYAYRTERNVIDSDGTLILYHGKLSGGTLLTNRLAQRHGRPLLRTRLDRPVSYQRIAGWIQRHGIRILNVAGPRGSTHPDIQAQAYEVVTKLLAHPGGLPLAEDR